MPGEEAIRKTELLLLRRREARRSRRSQPKWKDERYSDVRWGKSPGELRFIRRDRLQRQPRVLLAST